MFMRVHECKGKNLQTHTRLLSHVRVPVVGRLAVVMVRCKSRCFPGCSTAMPVPRICSGASPVVQKADPVLARQLRQASENRVPTSCGHTPCMAAQPMFHISRDGRVMADTDDQPLVLIIHKFMSHASIIFLQATIRSTRHLPGPSKKSSVLDSAAKNHPSE